jgi:hypothetical protein
VEFQAKLDADSEADAAKVEAADASLSELVAVAEQPPTEEPPVEENPAPPADGEPAPADNA